MKLVLVICVWVFVIVFDLVRFFILVTMFIFLL